MKKIIAILILIAIIPTMVFAETSSNTEKEEVVYGKISMQGLVEEIQIVNSFPRSDGNILDYGEYLDIKNLSDDTEALVDDDKIQFKTKSGDFYYQGHSRERDLPWKIMIDYRLDGKIIRPEKLLGKSGKLSIDIEIRKNPSVDPVYFDHYVLQISMQMDAEKVFNIQSEEATIASEGSHKLVTYTHLPGKESQYHLEADVQDCELGRIQIGGLPFELFMELPDMKEYTKDLLELEKAIAKLKDGVQQYTGGVSALLDGFHQLQAGADTLAENSKLLASGYQEYQSGVEQFQGGLGDYRDGMRRFQNGMSELTAGIQDFSDGIRQLKEGSSALSSGLTRYAAGMSEFSEGLSQLAGGAGELNQGAQEMGDGLQQLDDNGPKLVHGSAQILQALQTMDQALSFPMSEEEIQLLLSLFQSFSSAFNDFMQHVEATDFDTFLGLLRDALQRFDNTVGNIEAIADQLLNPDISVDPENEEAQALLQRMQQQGQALYEQTAELRAIKATLSGLDPLIQNLLNSLELIRDQYDVVRGLLQRLNDAIQSVSEEDILQLKDGLKLLSSNYQEFHDGLFQYVDGVHQIAQGFNAPVGMKFGIEQLSNGLNTLNPHGQTLAEGSAELAQGASLLDGGIGKLLNGSEEFASRGGEITEGVNSLVQGSESLYEGHRQLKEGSKEIGDGLGAFTGGLTQYAQGGREFQGGLSRLNQGGSELAEGMNMLAKETSGMDQKMQEKIDEFLKDYLPGDFTVKSFVSDKNTKIKTVQFVMLAEGVKKPQEEPPEPPPEVKPTLWQRFLNLFRFGQ